jgi:hypothetical protein
MPAGRSVTDLHRLVSANTTEFSRVVQAATDLSRLISPITGRTAQNSVAARASNKPELTRPNESQPELTRPKIIPFCPSTLSANQRRLAAHSHCDFPFAAQRTGSQRQLTAVNGTKIKICSLPQLPAPRVYFQKGSAFHPCSIRGKNRPLWCLIILVVQRPPVPATVPSSGAIRISLFLSLSLFLTPATPDFWNRSQSSPARH